MLGGRLQQLLGHPGKIGLDEPELRQRVLEMGVEAGGDQEEVGREASSAGRMRARSGAKILAVVAGLKRRVADIADAGLVEAPVPGKSGI